MKIKVHSSELNRMMKTISQCIDNKDIGNKGLINIVCDNNLLSIRGTNGTFSAVMSTPMMGGDGESFCVDGSMFARVCAMCNGEIEISTDGKTCTVRGAGRTRIPIVDAVVPAFERVTGKTTAMTGEAFQTCYSGVAHAISTDQGRIILTGVLMETVAEKVKMVALDGFQLAVESAACDGEEMRVVVPGGFMKLVANSVGAGEDVKITASSGRIQAETDGMLLGCGLLSGEYIDYEKLLPKEFATKMLVDGEKLMSALKGGSVVNSKQNLVKLEIGSDSVKVKNNSEEADYEAEIASQVQGKTPINIAFNQKYLMNTIGSIGTEEIEMRFNSSVAPCVMQGRDSDGVRLILPVRVMGT